MLVDWLPWSHTFGGNHNLNMVLRNGGTLYIDEGRPAPGLIEKTLRNLREVQPDAAASTCRAASTCCCRCWKPTTRWRAQVFARLRLAFYAGAALPPSTWQRLRGGGARACAASRCGSPPRGARPRPRPPSPRAHWRLDGAGCIGVPLPGLELKFVPNGDKLEMRVQGRLGVPRLPRRAAR